MGSAFLSADLALTPEPRPDHAGYLANWLDVLKADKRAIFTAASHAQRAADFLCRPSPPQQGRPHRMSAQLGFGDLLADADTANEQRQLDRATAHLPGTMAEALPFYRDMIDRHHAAMLAADIEEAMRIREDAHRLAAKLNGGTCGIIAGPEAPGCILEAETEAAPGNSCRFGDRRAILS